MKRLQLLDYGRFFAAFSVLAYHYTHKGIKAEKILSFELNEQISAITKFGHFGVEFFFVISGFVIYYSVKNRTPQQFAVARLKRLFPTYWVAVLITALIGLLYNQPHIIEVNTAKVLANLTMLPGKFGYANLDGVYWTLVYELKFYLLVFVIMMLRGDKKIIYWFQLWAVYIVSTNISGLAMPFNSSYFLLFIAGAHFAQIRIQKSKVLIASQVLLFLAIVYIKYISQSGNIIIYTAIIGGCFLFFVIQIQPKVEQWKLPCSKILGALTYPVYLIHGGIGYLVLNDIGSIKNQWWLISFVTIGVISISWFIHLFVEQKASKIWYNLFTVVTEKPINAVYKVIANLKSKASS